MSSFRLDVVSLVPEVFDSLRGLGVIGRAFNTGIAELHTHNPAITPLIATARSTMSPMGAALAWCSNPSRCLPPLKRSPATAPAGAADDAPGQAAAAG